MAADSMRWRFNHSFPPCSYPIGADYLHPPHHTLNAVKCGGVITNHTPYSYSISCSKCALLGLLAGKTFFYNKSIINYFFELLPIIHVELGTLAIAAGCIYPILCSKAAHAQRSIQRFIIGATKGKRRGYYG